MKKFQTYDRHNENRYERSQQRHDRYDENRYEKSQQRHDRINQNGYEKSQQRHNRYHENGYEKSQQRHDRYKENGYEISLRQRTEEANKFSKFDSSRHRKDGFSDEKRPVEHHQHSYQIERKPKRIISPQAYLKALKDLVKNEPVINRIDEQEHLNKANNISQQSTSKDYEKIRKGAHPLSPENRMLHPCSKNLNVKDEVSSLYDANDGCIKERKNSYISEENSSRNTDVTNSQFVHENSLPFLQKSNTSPYESNLDERRDSYTNEETSSENLDVKTFQFCNENPLQFLQKSSISPYESNQNERRDSYISEGSSLGISDVKHFQFDNQNPLPFHQRRNTSFESDHSSAYVQDMSQMNVHTQKVEGNFQSDKNITPNSSLRVMFQNESSNKDFGFNMLRLIDLIHYNANLMQCEKLFEFASAVKSKLLEKIDKFEHPENEELQFLCEISDGDQSEKNQRIITSRACRIVKNIIDKFPHFLNALEPPLPPPQVIVYQTIPSSHVVTNSYCNNYESAVLEIVQNSEVLNSATNYSTVPAYNLPSTARFVVAKEILDSSDSQNPPNYPISNCEVQELPINSAKNNSPINLSLITKENKEIDESSKHRKSPVNPKSTPMHEFPFKEKENVFTSLSFNDLLDCDVEKLQGDMVFDYAYSMKHRIIEKINLNQFRSPYKEKLYFLCQITDGTQREQNQKLINNRMIELIISDYEDRLNVCNFSDEQSENDHQRRSH